MYNYHKKKKKTKNKKQKQKKQKQKPRRTNRAGEMNNALEPHVYCNLILGLIKM